MPPPQVPQGVDPQFTTPQRQGTLNTVSSVMDPLVGNSGLQTALSVLESISDVGKAVPLIAPAFVLLKIIIDIERTAEEVDVKCNDLVERIAFMLSHLPVLKKIEIMPSTQRVIERMNEALKEAAALISTYRKQSLLARRLSFTNREKFTLCVENVNTCCQDLLMSLQIHQSKQLEILTRAVPLDEADKAAASFVKEHGGDFEAVKYDRELVKEFAIQQHLDMDDSVMAQLEGSVSDVVEETQVRLETIVKDNVAKAIADGFKSLATQLYVTESEQQFICIQCEQSFTRSSNGPKACSFHKADYDSWSKSFPCCGEKHPCEYSFHREKHHCDYPYGNFFPRIWKINNYMDTHEDWAAIVDTNLEDDNKVQKASVSQLIRWVSRGAQIDKPTIVISVGRVYWKEEYYWNTFTIPELENISKSVRHSKRTLIFRTSPSEDEYAMAEWLLSISGKITGVKITAKAATSTTPFVRVVPIDLATGKKSGDVLEISNGGMTSYTPGSPYVLPETVRIGPELSDTQARPPRTDFKTRSSPSLRMILKSTGDPPLTANPNWASGENDFFVGSISAFNNNAPGSNLPITISEAKAEYRFVGEKDYKPVKGIKLEFAELPVTIDPRQSTTFKFEVTVPKSEEDKKQDVRWWNRAFSARHRPIRIKIILEDIEGEECSLVLEYVFSPFRFAKQRDEDLAAFYFDDPNEISRYMIRVEPSSNSDNVLRIEGNDIQAKKLQRVVYQALKTGKTEIDLEIGQEKGDGAWEWNAWALVDISCRRVYAFKILLQQGKRVEKKHFACLGHVLCPDYGIVQTKTRPISYATESVKLPPLEPYIPIEYKQDDTLDDKPPVPPKPALSPTRNGTGNGDSPVSSYANGHANGNTNTIQVPQELTQRLASLDNNLARIAVALEQLVGTLQAKAA